MTRCLFDLLHLYYLPQFLPVVTQLHQRGCEIGFVVYYSADTHGITCKAIEDEGFSYTVVKSEMEAIEYYKTQKSDWIIFGNAPSVEYQCLRGGTTKLGFMQHGIGPKACYYDTSEFAFDVRFVEGAVRKQRLDELYPEQTFVDVGYAKLDPLFNDSQQDIQLELLGLDPTKPTILYAPTFFPSSIECFKKEWPETLKQYNLIVKPHFFSLTKEKYNTQAKRINAWTRYQNVYVCPVQDYSLLPFMKVSDIMLSEASSTLFEFIAMDKPVIWCDFYHVRWSYRGIFKYRLGQRMDEDLALFDLISTRVKKAKDVPYAIERTLENPGEKASARKMVTQNMVGATDGKCAERIAHFLIQGRG